MPLPKYLKKYFWDVDFKKINPRQKKEFIATRVLEMGDKKALKWLLKNYNSRVFKKIIQNSRELSLKNANFWSIYFNINKKKIKCLSKHYLQQRKQVWLY